MISHPPRTWQERGGWNFVNSRLQPLRPRGFQIFARLRALWREFLLRRTMRQGVLPDPQQVLDQQLTPAMATQQQKPMKIGLPPVLTSFTILVFMPIAAIAITIKNLDSVLSGVNTPAGTPTVVHTVVMMDASTKYRINIGNARLSENFAAPALLGLGLVGAPQRQYERDRDDRQRGASA